MSIDDTIKQVEVEFNRQRAGMSALMDEAIGEIERLKAQNAAMREALDTLKHAIADFRHNKGWNCSLDWLIDLAEQALSTTPPTSYVSREAVMPLIGALNGFMWLGNNLHNIAEDPVRFGEYYKATMIDAERALTTAREFGLLK